MMHPQIKQVIESLLFQQGKVYVRLSAGEQTPLGKIIGRAYYETDVLSLLNHTERCGYPHNGGQHTLVLACRPLDVIELLEVLKEVAAARLCHTEEEREVAHQLSYISQEIHALRRSNKA